MRFDRRLLGIIVSLPPAKMLAVPLVLQQTHEDCWKSCSVMLAQSVGKIFTEDEVGVAADGKSIDHPSDGQHIVSALRVLGVQCQLAQPLAWPVLLGEVADGNAAIIGIAYTNQPGGHFILAIGYRENGDILINDPFQGQLWRTWAQLMYDYEIPAIRSVGGWFCSIGQAKLIPKTTWMPIQ
jgi:Papain-like cysteine protease AvrRpt2